MHYPEADGYAVKQGGVMADGWRKEGDCWVVPFLKGDDRYPTDSILNLGMQPGEGATPRSRALLGHPSLGIAVLVEVPGDGLGGEAIEQYAYPNYGGPHSCPFRRNGTYCAADN
ncbi:MAG: hypothetical protein JW384_04147 [Nitrosomonadaceae bacterium]|nr:hypothetical protein [Nitrosomonadaceae bacterium]